MKQTLAIGSLALGRTPLVVGAISSPLTIDRIAGGFRPACDVAEFRADLFGIDTPDWMACAQVLEQEGLPVLLTIRHPREGGRWYRSEEERAAIYRQAAPFVSAIDVEIQSPCFGEMARCAHDSHRLIVGSFHDFGGMPSSENLLGIIDEGRTAGADIVKIAALTNDEDDVRRLEWLFGQRPEGLLCLLGMGPMGNESRVRLALGGSCLTYGYVDEANAPGQRSSQELQQKLAAALPAYRQGLASRGRVAK